MAMRSQVYEWIGEPGGIIAASTAVSDQRQRGFGTVAVPVPMPAGTQNSIFVGVWGRAITKPAETTATQFVVIEDFGSTPGFTTVLGLGLEQQPMLTPVAGHLIQPSLYGGGLVPALNPAPNGQVQIRINTTDYFLRPDGIPFPGIDGSAAPYPRSVWFRPSFNLFPDVYILPGQVWDILYTVGNPLGCTIANNECRGARVFVKYTLYDGPDAFIANKLLEMGITVNPGNVDWYKRSLVEQGAVA